VRSCAFGPPGATRPLSGPVTDRSAPGSRFGSELPPWIAGSGSPGSNPRQSSPDGARGWSPRCARPGPEHSEPSVGLWIRPQSGERSPHGQTSATCPGVPISGRGAWHGATFVPGWRGVTPGNASTGSPSWFGPVALQAALVGQPVVFRAERGTELLERGRILPLDESQERGWREGGILLNEGRERVA
jgi:hypothetical protein